ncbi:Brix-domain-containing protein [Exidia glandulosa HHB12029]|uniref:Ribosome production factor 2 homolog n=1 Tax=Exidia glandulosa HHB12029 TaxID=1314781 RepID=A0A165E604_EXIGL|nr:Brix-domain-containing protein [Exidia glandulosa HHB12029]
MLRTIKPKNARSKRALQAREPKEVEDPRTCIFVRGTHTGEVLNGVMKDLMALKRPHAVSFSKKNTVRPFEDASSLEFWANKNDASMFVVGQTTKKRPDGLTFARMFDGRILDMLELGVTAYTPMSAFKTQKATPGNRPLVHFASELFDANPRLAQVKSMLLDLFGGGEASDALCLSGIEHVVSVTLGPAPHTPSTTTTIPGQPEPLPTVHLRVFTVQLLASGIRTPRVELVPHGPSLDFAIRRHTDADPEMLKHAMKRPKLAKKDVESGLGKKRKNFEVDEMGDLRGKIHMGKQDLGKLQTRKMKGLRPALDEMDVDEDGEEGPIAKRRKDDA